MQFFMQLLSSLISLYMLLILIRIVLTWFSGVQFGRPFEILSSITDPYLDWWRGILNLRFGAVDLSPLVAITALSLAQNIFSAFARYGKISLGIILVIILQALWSVMTFFLGFFIVILILCLIAHLLKLNVYSPFWRLINSISQPILFRINRILFGKRLVNYLTSIIISLIILLVIRIAGGFAVWQASLLLAKLPI